MTVSVRGRSDVSRYLAQLPDVIAKRLLQPSARAGGKVLAREIKSRSISQDVSDAIVVKTRTEPTRIRVRVTVKGGWPASVANWLEYGTTRHFISVDDSARAGRSVRRINELANEPGNSHSLVINGNFVGKTVLHPGAGAHPLFRPGLDAAAGDAIKTMQNEIYARLRKGGMAIDIPEGGEE